MNKIILIVFLILGITVNVFGATREKILRTGLVDTFAELDAIVADKALVNLADGGTFTGNIIANGNLSIGNAATTAGVLTLLEDTDAGSNFASFQVPALAANTIYTLPNAVGAAGNVLTDAAGNGILSWVEGGAGAGDITSVGDVATGAAFDGTQGTILTFYDVGGNMTLTYNGTTLTASKYITANVTGALTGNADTVTNGVYTGDAGTVFLAPAGDGASLTNVIHTEVDPTVDTAAEILTILDDTALDFGTGVLTATGFAGPLTGNADTVTNATLTTALTVNTGAVTLVGNAGASALTLGAGASSFSGTSSGTNTGGNTGDNTVATSGDSATDFFGEGEIVDARISDTLTSSTCTGNAATVSTNANLTGEVTSTGNAAVLDPTCISGKADTTIADGDFVLFWDLTDSTLKKVDGAELTAGGGTSLGDNVITVATANADYTSIDTALNNADAGDVILVAPGTYTETITFDDDNVTIRATGSKEDTTITQAAATVVNFSTKEGCVLEGFTISVTAADGTADGCFSGANDTSDNTPNIIKDCDLTWASSVLLVGGTYGNITDGDWEFINCNIKATNTYADTGANWFYGIYTRTAAGILTFRNCKFNISNAGTATSAVGNMAMLINIASTINVWNCDFTVSGAFGAAAGYSAAIKCGAGAAVVNAYGNVFDIDESGAGTSKGAFAVEITGSIVNSHNNSIDSNSVSGNEYWATIVSGATLNSYGDQIIDGALSNAGTANLYDTNEKGIITNAKNSGARAYQASGQAISTATLTIVDVPTESYDIQAEFANDRFTATVAGYYLVYGQVVWTSPEVDYAFYNYIYKNGGAIIEYLSYPQSTRRETQIVTTVIYLTVNDYIEMKVYHSATGSETLTAGSTTTYLEVNKMR